MQTRRDANDRIALGIESLPFQEHDAVDGPVLTVRFERLPRERALAGQKRKGAGVAMGPDEAHARVAERTFTIEEHERRAAF